MNAPSESCDRRGFLIRAAALLGTGVAAACEPGAFSPLLEGTDGGDVSLALHGSGTLHIFANESGLFADREPFVVGLLLTDAPDAHATELGDLLTGSVRGDMARRVKGRSNPRGRSSSGNVMDRLITSLKDRLNVQRLAHPSLAEGGRFPPDTDERRRADVSLGIEVIAEPHNFSHSIRYDHHEPDLDAERNEEVP